MRSMVHAATNPSFIGMSKQPTSADDSTKDERVFEKLPQSKNCVNFLASLCIFMIFILNILRINFLQWICSQKIMETIL